MAPKPTRATPFPTVDASPSTVLPADSAARSGAVTTWPRLCQNPPPRLFTTPAATAWLTGSPGVLPLAASAYAVCGDTNGYAFDWATTPWASAGFTFWEAYDTRASVMDRWRRAASWSA